jgi:hypothetical protein
MPAIADVRLLGASTKELRKAAISCVMFLRPSMRMEQHQPHQLDFHEIVYLGFFLMSFETFSFYSDLDVNKKRFTR